MRLLQRIDRVIGLESENQVAVEFGRERIRSVRSFIGIYYLAILAPYLGTAWGNWDLAVTRVVGGILLAIVALRFRHWAKPPPEGKSEDVNAVAARVTGLMVVILSCTQASFYVLLSLETARASPGSMAWVQIMGLGLLAALAQGAALTGIIFASRVIFFCFALPVALASLYLFAGEHLPVSIGVAVVTTISYFLAEASHKTQLQLFKAQQDAGEALVRMEKTNLALVAAKKQAQHQADTDQLTGIRSRFAFICDVETKLDGGQTGLVAVVDLERFKPINDLYGYHAGDQVLCEVARRLERSTPRGAIVGRLGGHEFGLFIPGASSPRMLRRMVAACDNALAELRQPMQLETAVVSIGARAGARMIGTDAADVVRALRDANAALNAARHLGQEPTKLYDDGMRKDTQWVQSIEASLLGLETFSDLSLAYQPIMNLRTGELTAFEALARWQHPTLGEISPAQFIPAAERLGRIEEITIELLGKALDFAASWDPPCRLSFNLSAAHLCSEGAAREIIEVIRAKRFPSRRLQFEITETAMLVNFEIARANVEMLRDAGCRMALDDFGAGFASLRYLREISFDKVKIDGSLIRNARNPQGRSMLRGVIKMLEAMNLESVAEYIATHEDRETALELGAECGQGYFLGHPLTSEEVLLRLARSREPQGENIHSIVGLQGEPAVPGPFDTPPSVPNQGII